MTPRYIFLDTETALIAPGLLRPPLTLVTFHEPHGGTWIEDHEEGPDTLEGFLDADWHLVGHNIAYDLAVLTNELPRLMPKIFAAYAEGRIHDTQIRQWLIDIANGNLKFYDDENGAAVKSDYSLAALTLRLCGRTLPKDDAIRLAFGPYRGRLDLLPAGMRAYALGDVLATHDVFKAQQGGPNLHDEAAQCRAYWALHLMSCEGLHTDPAAVAALRKSLETDYYTTQKTLLAEGLFRVGGTKKKPKLVQTKQNVRLRVIKAFGFAPLPLTKGGKVSTDADTLIQSGDPVLKQLAEYGKIAKLFETYIPLLEAGVVNPSYGIAATGRTTSFKPNIQNQPRKSGARECFVPDTPGDVFIECDFDAAEMFALAQVRLWLGQSPKLAKSLVAGRDPHLEIVATMLGISYEEAARRKGELAEIRVGAKVANYGFGGGMGAPAFVKHARKYGVELTLAQSNALKNGYYRAWDMRSYFDHIEHLTPGPVTQFVSLRVRGDCGYCDGANTLFQGLVADFAKAACFEVARECYTVPASPLFGCRPKMFGHDAILLQAPALQAHEAALRLQEIMVAAGRRVCPDVWPGATFAAMRAWSKDAKAVFDAAGRLVPWEPMKKAA